MPITNSFLDTEITYLKGVGPERAKTLTSELNIRTFYDLLTHYPFRYIDRTKIYPIQEITGEMPFVQFKAKVVSAELMGVNKGKRLVAEVTDGTGTMELVWFKGIKWVAPKLKLGVEFIVFGKPAIFNGKMNIAHPDIDIATEENILIAKKLQPVYHSAEKLKSGWLDSKGISKLERTLVAQINKNIPETLSQEIIKKYNLISKEEACKIIHLPDNNEQLQKAIYRLKFEELFFLQLRLLRIKGIRKKTYSGLVFDKVGNYFNDFYNNHLPFPLTNAQKRVLKEIRSDMGTGKQMNRLLQGDVGSGKTIVALMSMLLALDNGFQTCLMAPTEILATQHFKNLSKLLLKSQVHCALLTGSTKQTERNDIHNKLQNGELHILIGTHALIEEEVQFMNLGFVVVDEQHKFGVAQRSKLWMKGVSIPHVLIMTATPIPRTLAMTLYGDLDVSVIDELPPGRTPVKTLWRSYAKQDEVFKFIQEQLDKGRQAYIVYPIIEESKILDYKNLEQGYELVKKIFVPDPLLQQESNNRYSIGMVHGRLKPKMKEEQMNRFASGVTNILVATTVIEVGVDVPNASIMVIESAERFGLSQLHQLRGRVGRGAEESFCILMTGYEISGVARTRMDTMVRTTDGFEIAETDMRLRGPGDISGTQQSGILDFKIADISRDAQLLQYTRTVAEELLNADPELTLPENVPLLTELNRIKREKPYWGRIS